MNPYSQFPHAHRIACLVWIVAAGYGLAQTVELEVRVEPSSAEVVVSEDRFLGGDKWSEFAPDAAFALEAGRYVVSVTAPVHEPYRESIELTSDRQMTVELEPDYVSAGTPVEIGDWLLQAGWSGQGVLFERSIGDSFMSESADSGFVFALVPVAIQNDSRETQSFTFPTWNLSDERGYEYTSVTMADMYLDESMVFDALEVPPGAERSGFVVFQVREDVETLFLQFQGFRHEGAWRF